MRCVVSGSPGPGQARCLERLFIVYGRIVEPGQRRLEPNPASLCHQVWIAPFGQIIRHAAERLYGKGVNALIGQARGQSVYGFDLGWTLTLRGIDDIVGMGHLALTIEIFDAARNDPG